MDSSVISLLDEQVFSEGYPDFWPFERDIYLSSEFTDWVINRAKEVGVSDKRLKYNASPRVTLTVDLKDFYPSYGSLTFNVFGEIYTVPAEEVNLHWPQPINSR